MYVVYIKINLEIHIVINLYWTFYSLNHRLWSQEQGSPRPHFLAQGVQKGVHHFELQPLVCSGKVITLTQHTQQCITQVTKVTTNSQQDP